MSTNLECSLCLFDSSLPEISFDSTGVCTYCRLHARMKKFNPKKLQGSRILRRTINEIKKSNKKKYNCVVGVSGGVDSSFSLYLAAKFGLKPLAVHVDNGWNSELAVENIQIITNKLGVDLHTEVLDWKSFKDLQLSFLKASVPDGEIPTDMTLLPNLFSVCRQVGASYVIAGFNTAAQGVSPIGWTYMDKKYIDSVHNFFGKESIQSIRFLSIMDLLYTTFFKNIRTVSFLENIDYRTEPAKQILQQKLGWRPYEGKHYESIYTKFFQGYILPTKFNIDKRKIYLSTLIRENRITKTEAKHELSFSPYSSQEEIIKDKRYVLKKLEITEEEFHEIMNLPIKSYKDYETYLEMIYTLRHPIRLVCQLGILPMTFYEKYIKILQT